MDLKKNNLKNFMFNEHAFKKFALAIIHVDFMGFPFRIPSVIHHNKKH
jgi:hypothetical protein